MLDPFRFLPYLLWNAIEVLDVAIRRRLTRLFCDRVRLLPSAIARRLRDFSGIVCNRSAPRFRLLLSQLEQR